MTDLAQRVIDENQKAVALAKDLHELCDLSLEVQLFQDNEQATITAIRKLRSLAMELRNKHIIYADTD